MFNASYLLSSTMNKLLKSRCHSVLHPVTCHESTARLLYYSDNHQPWRCRLPEPSKIQYMHVVHIIWFARVNLWPELDAWSWIPLKPTKTNHFVADTELEFLDRIKMLFKKRVAMILNQKCFNLWVQLNNSFCAQLRTLIYAVWFCGD